jgi:hypothetical protein
MSCFALATSLLFGLASIKTDVTADDLDRFPSKATAERALETQLSRTRRCLNALRDKRLSREEREELERWMSETNRRMSLWHVLNDARRTTKQYEAIGLLMDLRRGLGPIGLDWWWGRMPAPLAWTWGAES